MQNTDIVGSNGIITKIVSTPDCSPGEFLLRFPFLRENMARISQKPLFISDYYLAARHRLIAVQGIFATIHSTLMK